MQETKTSSTADSTQSSKTLRLNNNVGLIQRLKNMLETRKRKIIFSIVLAIVVAGILYAVPSTRYGILGTVIKKDVKIIVIDSQTKKPVSEATVALADKLVKSKADGKVLFSQVPVGEYTITINKKYYKNSSAAYVVPVFEAPNVLSVNFEATGRQVAVSVVNKITKAPLTKALIRASDTSAVTDEKGLTTIVLPPNKPAQDATVTLDGYNELKTTIKVSENKDDNQLALTPKGSMYYLSKITGKINVMQSNLDGSEAKVVVAGTGKEQERQTVLLASRDWQYLALLSRRDGDGGPQLYVLDAKSGSLQTVDARGLNIELVGWWGHRFVYASSKNIDVAGYLQDKTLYSYDAETGKTATLDATTNAERGVNQYQETDDLSGFYIVEGNVVYIMGWSVPDSGTSDKKSAIKQVGVDGSNLKKLKEFPKNMYSYIAARSNGPNDVMFRAWLNNNTPEFYEYQNASLKKVSSNDDDFYNEFYATYLLSPSGKKTFWYEPRNGKNTLLIGDWEGNNTTNLDTLSEYSTYGWFTDDYVLVSKNGSELFIASSKDSFTKSPPLKISDYHKPQQIYLGYGSGYGGL